MSYAFAAEIVRKFPHHPRHFAPPRQLPVRPAISRRARPGGQAAYFIV